MPYLHLNLSKSYPAPVKREIATRLCKLYSSIMQTEPWRPNVGIAELGADNIFHMKGDELEPINMILIEVRRGRPDDLRLQLANAIVDACVEILKVPRETLLIEFTTHSATEMFRSGRWTSEWSEAEAQAS